MSATNLTKNLKLPQFVASDKPSWLGDVNGAMKNIDDGIGVIKGDITKASDTASSAKSQSDANTVTLGNVNTELESIGNRVTALEAGGGTEQLEQRVQTVEADVESLQTRADTFEEEIAENGTKITANAKSITDLTPRVKSCEDNITSLTTTTSGLSETVQTQEVSITGLSSSVQDNSNKIITLEQSSGNNNAAISTLSNRVDALESKSSPISYFNRVNVTSYDSGTYAPDVIFLRGRSSEKGTYYLENFCVPTSSLRTSMQNPGALFTFALPSDLNAPVLFGSTFKQKCPVFFQNSAGTCQVYYDYNTSNRVLTFYATDASVSSSTGLICFTSFQIITG